MARLSKEAHDEILQKMSEGINADPEMMDLVDKLRSDFDESIAIDVDEVKRDYDDRLAAMGEENERLRGEADTMRTERDTAIGERDEARRQYRERFFDARKEAEEIVAREKKDSPRGLSSVLNIENA